MATMTISDSRISKIERHVCLTGLTPIMFDRYAGDNSTKLDWTQKIYLEPNTSTLVLPVTNIVSFLTAHNTNSAPKRLRDKRKYKDIANACLSFVQISTPDSMENIPFLRGGNPVLVGAFGKDRDASSGLYLHRTVARLEKGIPNPKERAVLPLPWSLEFSLTLYENREIKEQEVYNLFKEGGLAIGLGTFRGVYGKFDVSTWD